MLKNYIKKILVNGYKADFQIIRRENLHMIVVIIFFAMTVVKDTMFMAIKNKKKHSEKNLIKIL